MLKTQFIKFILPAVNNRNLVYDSEAHLSHIESSNLKIVPSHVTSTSLEDAEMFDRTSPEQQDHPATGTGEYEFNP
jgi:hypothetical protein